VFELTVEAEFCAAHAISIRGEREPVHGHNWRMSATVVGERLDRDGLLVDFHLIERQLREIARRFDNADLNRTPPFDRENPTAEIIVRHIAHELAASLTDVSGVRVSSVRLTEAPGCSVVYRPKIDEGSVERNPT
jgi:6-pyruvoyltetrahydropterin/6-carboxytetrahydropterin synthase